MAKLSVQTLPVHLCTPDMPDEDKHIRYCTRSCPSVAAVLDGNLLVCTAMDDEVSEFTPCEVWCKFIRLALIRNSPEPLKYIQEPLFLVTDDDVYDVDAFIRFVKEEEWEIFLSK